MTKQLSALIRVFMYWGRPVKIDTALYPISTQRNLAVASKNISMLLNPNFYGRHGRTGTSDSTSSVLSHGHHVHCFHRIPHGQRLYHNPCRVESLIGWLVEVNWLIGQIDQSKALDWTDSLFVGPLGSSFIARSSR